MESKSLCSNSDCQNSASLYCECVPEAPQFCNDHFLEHFQSDFKKKHIPRHLFLTLKPKTIQRLIHIKTNLQESLKTINTRLMNEMNLAISSTYSTVSDRMKRISNEFEAFLFEIDEAIATPEISINTNNPILAGLVNQKGETLMKLDKQSELSYECIGEIIQGGENEATKHIPYVCGLRSDAEIQTWDPLFEGILKLGLDKTLAEFMVKMIQSSHEKELLKAKEAENRFVHFFLAGTTDLIRLDLKRKSIEQVLSGATQLMGKYVATCKTKVNSLFCSGGTRNPSACYLLNLLDYSVTPMPALIHGRSRHACAESNNQIYVFGGFRDGSGQPLSDCSCLNLNTNQWSTIKPFQSTVQCTTAVPYKNSIFVTGYELKTVLLYDIAKNDYQTVFQIPSGACKHKVLFMVEDKLYLMSDNSFYNCSLNTNTEWNHILVSPVGISKYPTLQPHRYLDSIYFIRKYKLYEIALPTLQVSISSLAL